jgi:hypothetical protein
MKIKKLKPCPFCGSQVAIKSVNGVYRIECPNEDCFINFQRCINDKLLTEVWNTRLRPRKTQQKETHESLIENKA